LQLPACHPIPFGNYIIRQGSVSSPGMDELQERDAKTAMTKS